MPVQIDERQLFGWKELLLYHNPCLDSDGGIDLNEDGAIEDAEVIEDTNQNNAIDENEAKAFCIKNRDTLAQNINFFRFGQDFSPDNPIHSVILYESQIFGFTDDQVEVVYSRLSDIFHSVKQLYQFESEWNEMYPVWSNEGEPSPIDAMNVFRQAVMENGAAFGEPDNPSEHIFILSVLLGRYECSHSTYAFTAVAHEMDWPAHASLLPQHMIAQWVNEEDSSKLNLDISRGKSLSNEEYMNLNNFNIHQRSIDLGAYLNPLTTTQLEGAFLCQTAVVLSYNNQTIAAEELVRQSFSSYPDQVAALNIFGLSNLDLFDLEEARWAYNKVKEYDPMDFFACDGLAQINIMEGKYEEAINELSMAMSLYPRTHRDDSNMSFYSDALPKWDEIILNYRKTMRYKPSLLAKAYENRGFINLQLGNYEEAQRDFKSANKINPTAFSYTYKGYADMHLGDMAEASKSFGKAMDIDPNFSKAYEGMGMIFGMTGLNDKAVEILNIAIQMEPTATAYTYLGLAYKRLYDEEKDETLGLEYLEKALESFDKAVEIDPYNGEAKMFRDLSRQLLEI